MLGLDFKCLTIYWLIIALIQGLVNTIPCIRSVGKPGKRA